MHCVEIWELPLQVCWQIPEGASCIRSLLHVQKGQPTLHIVRMSLVIPVLGKPFNANPANTAHTMLHVQTGQLASNACL